MKHIQPFLLVCMHSPRLTSIKQSTDYTGFIHIDFGMFCQPVVRPYIFCEPGECCDGFPNSRIELTVDGEVVCDGRPQVQKLMNDLQFVVVDEERRCFLNVLSHDLRFCQADGRSKMSASIRKVVQKLLKVFQSVSCYGHIICE